jgi:hypothetical protein
MAFLAQAETVGAVSSLEDLFEAGMKRYFLFPLVFFVLSR